MQDREAECGVDYIHEEVLLSVLPRGARAAVDRARLYRMRSDTLGGADRLLYGLKWGGHAHQPGQPSGSRPELRRHVVRHRKRHWQHRRFRHPTSDSPLHEEWGE